MFAAYAIFPPQILPGGLDTLLAAPAMSLKAKIEAVIYASEEPVTLQQLVSLLGEEAQAELDAADARQGQLALETAATALLVDESDEIGESEADDPDALNAETLGPETFASPPHTGGGPTPAQGDGYASSTFEAEDSSDLRDFEGGRNTRTFEHEARTESPEAGASRTDNAPVDPSPAALRTRERRLREYLRSVLERLLAEYRAGDRGLEIREIAGGFRFATKPEYHDAVRGFVRSLKPPLKLSLQALETLAVVAYKQPVTAPEVSEVRGVDSGGVLGSLLGRKLVAAAGRKQVIGRPILYKTTKEFLLRFGLKDVSELPSIEEFERFASDINGALQEEIPMVPVSRQPQETVVPLGVAVEIGRLSPEEVAREVNTARDQEPSRGVHAAQADGDPNPSTPSPDEIDAEHLTPALDGPGEFTGNESVPPVDNSTIDGRISGVPPVYDTRNDEIADSSANDAAVGSADSEQLENAGSDD